MAASRRQHGEGSIYQRSDGRWMYAYVVWEGGVRKRRTISAPTSAALLKKKRQLDLARASGVVESTDKVSAWLDHWLDVIAPARARDATLAGYRSKVEQYLKPTLGRYRLDQLTADHVLAMHKYIRDKGLSDTTVRHAHAILHRALAVAYAQGRVMRNVAGADVSPKTPAVKPHATLTWEQARLVIEHADGPRDLARLQMALGVGLRQGEALGLRWTDVDLSAGTVSVQRSLTRDPKGHLVEGATKSKRSVRTIAPSRSVMAALKSWREVSGGVGYVFPSPRGPEVPCNPRSDWQAWKDACNRARVPAVPLHGARSAAASMMAKAGILERVIADTLGHDPRVSIVHYQHSDEAQRRDALAVLDLTPSAPPADAPDAPAAP